MRRAFVALALVVLAVGCGEDEETTSGPAPAGPLVTYARSGGIAFNVVELTVEPDGQATLGGEAAGKPAPGAAFELPADDLADLERLVEDAEAADVESSSEPGCADCYAYELGLPDRTLRFDSATLPPELEPLVGELDAIAAEHGARDEPNGG